MLFVSLNAQSNLDSLYSVWTNQKYSDSLRADAYDKFIYSKYIDTNIDSLITEANNLIKFGKQNNYPLAVSYGYRLIGEGYYERGLLSNSLENFNKSYDIVVQLGQEKQFTSLINTLGILQSNLGNSAKALEYFQMGLKISKEQGNQETMELCITNIGGIYYSLKNFDKALEYYEQGKTLEKEIGDRIGYASSLNLISRVLIDKGNTEKAKSYLNEAILVFEEEKEEYGTLEAYFILAEISTINQEYLKALEYFQKCANSEIVENSSESKSYLYNSIGDVYIKLKQFDKAKANCEIGLANAKDSGIISEKIRASQCLYLAYKALNNEKIALKYLEESISVEDSLKTQEAYNKITQMEVEKQALNDSIQAAKERFDLKLAHQLEVQQKNRIRNIILVISAFIIVISIGLYSRWKSTQKSKAIIEKEKERSDNLLLNILPADIAKELKEKGKADARDFDIVSILFTDFKGFTKAAEKLTAKALVNEINDCFKAFDHIIEKYKIEKIKTIGDAYMAAGGLPIPYKNYVKNTVLAGLEMQDFIIKRREKAEIDNRVSFEMRVGIHTGPIVAGIVGVKKFQFDIWGDTVNTASRMESSGQVNKVNISQFTYELIKDDPLFNFEHRGKILAKGKGEIDMYFVQLKA
jgi:class 3 adenylate cyclase